MSIMGRFFGKKVEHDLNHPGLLIDYFLKQENREDFPLQTAFKSLEKLEESASTQEEFFSFLLEDVVFSSLYATFYEELFLTLKSNQSISTQIIENFFNCSMERDNIIGSQAQSHVDFVENLGSCPGCECCQNHKDVAELIPYWQRGDIDFFILLYLGMQTIHACFDLLLEEGFVRNPDLLNELSREKVLKFRQFLFEYTEKNITSA